jgi:hypothetical protein
MIFTSSLVLAGVAFVAAAILAFRLKRALPAVHSSVGAPISREWWPFWVFHFLSPSKWRRLPAGLRFLAFVAMSALALAVMLLAFIVLRFATSGGSL